MEDLYVLRTDEEIKALVEYLSDKELISIDTETTGLEKTRKIIGFSVAADLDKAFYVVLKEFDPFSNEITQLNNWEASKKLLEGLRGKKLVAHNSIFDMETINLEFGIDLMPDVFADTLVMAHILNENRFLGLKDLGTQYFGESATDEQKLMKESILKNGGSVTKGCYELYKADPDLIGKYGAKDTILTLKLFVEFVKEIENTPLEAFFFEEESMPLLRGATYQLNTLGLKIDEERLQKLKIELIETCRRDKEFIEAAIKPLVQAEYPGTNKKNTFNIGSGKQLSWLLFVKLNNDFIDLTKEGKNILREMGVRMPFSAKARREVKAILIQKKGEIYQESRLNPKTKKMSRPKKVGDIQNYLASDKPVLQHFAKRYRWVDKLLEYSKNLKLLNTYVEGIQEKAINGYIYPSFLQHGTTSGRYSSRNPNFQNLPREDKRIKSCISAGDGMSFVGADYCLHPESEILTPTGWVNIMDLKENTKVLQVDKDSLESNFVLPTRIIKKEFDGKMYEIGNKRGSLKITENHTMLYGGQNHINKPDKSKLRKVFLSQDGIPQKGMGFIPYTFNNLNSTYSEKEIWLATAIQADGSKTKTKNTYRIVVSYPRKVEKLNTLIGPGKKQTLENYSYRLKFESNLLTADKGLDLSTLGSNQAHILYEALAFWDGTKPKGSPSRIKYFSMDEKTVDSIQIFFIQSGYEATKKKDKNGLFTLFIRKESRVRLLPKDVKFESYHGMVGCVTVPKGFILVRYNGFVAITGNCQLEPRVFASLSKDKSLLDCFKSGDDFYSTIGSKVFDKHGISLKKEDKNSFADLFPELRQISKVVALSSTYGTTASKMSKAIGKDKQEAQEVIDEYFRKFPGVAAFMKESHELVKSNGYVESIYGRPRRIPKAKALPSLYGKTEHKDLPYDVRNLLNLAVNHRVQSSGASIVNRASIRFLELVKIAGIPDCAIVLQVHDEIVARCPEQYATKVKELLKEAMENTVILPGVDLLAEPKIGKTLADLK